MTVSSTVPQMGAVAGLPSQLPPSGPIVPTQRLPGLQQATQEPQASGGPPPGFEHVERNPQAVQDQIQQLRQS